MKKWQREIEYIHQNCTKQEDDIYFRIEFDLYSSIYDKVNYYFIFRKIHSEYVIFIWYGYKKFTIDIKANEISETLIFGHVVNYFARKMCEDNLLKEYDK